LLQSLPANWRAFFMAQGIIWFRNDLRVQQNAALEAAFKSGMPLKAIYILDSREERLGAFRRNFIRDALEELAQNLQEITIPLEIIEGNPNQVLSEIIALNDPNEIFANKGYAHEELKQEQELESFAQVNLHLFNDGFLISPENLPFTIHELPDTFTEFRKKLERIGLEELIGDSFEDERLSVPEKPAPTNTNSRHPKTAFPFRGGESAARKRLNDYLWETRNILRYKETRNGLLGTEYSSKFSAWLACGCISAQQIYAEIKRFEREVEANESTYWLVFELLWRDYFRYVMLKYGRKLFLAAGIKGATPRNEPVDADQRFYRWVNGTTGDDFVDANMRELKHTGFMSNRGRQNVASYLVHNLQLDWRKGARYFEKMLVDYDVFSNWGNWAYLGGVGNDPRENRVFNTQKQAEMYDPTGLYRKYWLGS
jgi:deoxyribodipyrimidine photo-lyase